MQETTKSTNPQPTVEKLTGTLTGSVDGAMADIAAAAAATAGGSSPSATNVDAGIATAVAPIVSGVNTQNKEIMTKLNELIEKVNALGLTKLS
jgi:anthranilate phosphoribosyltransferase